jgi:predicted permease
MSLWSELRERARALLLRRRQDLDLDDEIRDHLERETESLVHSGIDPAAARREALLRFGGVERTREEVRDARGVRAVEDLLSDTRYSLRALARNPGFTLTAAVVLGLGIGGSVAVFAVVDRLLLAELPYPQAGRLVRIFQQNTPGNRWGVSVADFNAIVEQQRSFEAVGLLRVGSAAVSGPNGPEVVAAGRATPGFFQALAVPAGRGRTFTPDDGADGANPVVVITHAFSVRTFGGAERAVGALLSIDGVSHVVVGVLPDGYQQLAGWQAPVWPILRLEAPERRGPFYNRGFARLRAGVSLEAAGRDLAGISERIFPLWASSFQDRSARLTPVPLREAIVGDVSRRLGLFAGAVALVLLVAVTNVATLLLVRASARERELAVRTALGATETRLARLVGTEIVILTLLATGVGLAVAALGVGYAAVIAPEVGRVGAVHLGGRAFALAVALGMVSGLLLTIAPLSVVFAGRSPASLRGDESRTGTSRRMNLLRSGLVALEFALALPLLLGAGLLLNSFVRLTRVDPGFDPRGAVSVAIALPQVRYPDPAATLRFWRQVLDQVAQAPGVSAAGLSTSVPPDNQGDTNNFVLLDRPVAPGTAEPVAPWGIVSQGYFQALGLTALDGRLFTAADTAGAPPVVVVSRTWAQRYFPNERVVGRQMISAGCSTCPPTTVVGVVGDVKFSGLDQAGEMVYEPLGQGLRSSMFLLLRGTAGHAALAAAARQAIHALDPDLATVETTLEDRLRRSLTGAGQWTAVFGGFAVTAIGLAALGIFGLMSFVVRQRRREIAVRIALGAEPRSVTRLIVGLGMRCALAGTAMGVAIGLGQQRWLPALLYEVSPTDPLTLVSGSGMLLLTALVACWVPGRRAARIRPLEAIGAD